METMERGKTIRFSQILYRFRKTEFLVVINEITGKEFARANPRRICNEQKYNFLMRYCVHNIEPCGKGLKVYVSEYIGEPHKVPIIWVMGDEIKEEIARYINSRIKGAVFIYQVDTSLYAFEFTLNIDLDVEYKPTTFLTVYNNIVLDDIPHVGQLMIGKCSGMLKRQIQKPEYCTWNNPEYKQGSGQRIY